MFKRTTNSSADGIDAQIKHLVRTHRGLSPEHQRRICTWWLYWHAQLPDDPMDITRQPHWRQSQLIKAHTLITHEKQATIGHDDGRTPPSTMPSALPTSTLRELERAPYANP